MRKLFVESNCEWFGILLFTFLMEAVCSQFRTYSRFLWHIVTRIGWVIRLLVLDSIIFLFCFCWMSGMRSDGGRAKKFNTHFVRRCQAFKQQTKRAQMNVAIENRTQKGKLRRKDGGVWVKLEGGWNKMSICFNFGVHVKTKDRTATTLRSHTQNYSKQKRKLKSTKKTN